MKNRYSAPMTAVLGLFTVYFAGIALADEEFPSTYQDDVYHCQDPKNNKNPIRCDRDTYLWDIGDLDPKKKPDNSRLCEEIVKILVKAVAEEDAGAEKAMETQKDVELWESIMESSVVDQMEPCVLWAMAFGELTPYADAMGFNEERGVEPEEPVAELEMSDEQSPDVDGNYGE